MTRRIALVVLGLLAAGCDRATLARVPEPVTNPDILVWGSAGNLSVVENMGGGSCRWSRVEPDGTKRLVDELPVECLDARLYWNRLGTHALLVTWDLADEASAWEVDLGWHTIHRVVPPKGDRFYKGMMSPDAVITLSTKRAQQPNGTLRSVLATAGLAEPCVHGRLGAWRSRSEGEWTALPSVEVDCNGDSLGDVPIGEDFTWVRPGVVEEPVEMPDGTPALRNVRRRGDFALVPGKYGETRLASTKGVSGWLLDGRVEFWPAKLDPAWEQIPAQEPQDWSDTP